LYLFCHLTCPIDFIHCPYSSVSTTVPHCNNVVMGIIATVFLDNWEKNTGKNERPVYLGVEIRHEDDRSTARRNMVGRRCSRRLAHGWSRRRQERGSSAHPGVHERHVTGATTHRHAVVAKLRMHRHVTTAARRSSCNIHQQRSEMYEGIGALSTHCVYSVSQKIPRWDFLTFSPKRLGIFSPNFTRLLCVPIHAGLQIFIELSITLTKLCHLKRDHHNVLKMSTIDWNARWVVALNMT